MKQIKDRDLFSVKSNKHEEVKRFKNKKKLEPKKKSEAKEEVKEEDQSGEVDEDFEIKHVPISYENIHIGQIILGSVLHVFKYEIIISLPNRMTGHLPAMYLSKSYNDLLYKISEGKNSSNIVYSLEELYPPGHLLVTKVISVLRYDNGTSKITLSALPQDVNCELTASLLSKHSIVQCAVVSEEENGYIMETGIRSIHSAFLSKKYSPAGTFGVGSVLLCAVKKTIDDTEGSGETNINLSAEPSYVNKEASLSKEKTNIASIFPGTLVSGTVIRVIPEGLELSFGEFRGFVRKENLTSRAENIKNFVNGQNVSARVLYITDLASEIVCSVNAKLCSESAFTSILSNLSIDNIYSGNFIRDSSEGAYFALPEGNYGLCPKRNWDKYKKEKNKKRFQTGKSYQCRVTHIHLIDQLYNVVLESKENSSGAMFYVGEYVSVKIAEHNPNGALAVISKTRKICRIPKHHLCDSNVSNPENKYRIGQTFKGRILKYFSGKDPVLTLKSDLITTKLPIVTEHSESHVGTVTLGCVVKLYKKNILVEFFNDCKALILSKDIPSHLRQDLNAHFEIGSVVKCKILSYDDSEKRMFASLVEDIKGDELKNENQPKSKSESKVESKDDKLLRSPSLKDFVNCKIFSVNKENVEVIIEGFSEKGCIPLHHLADDIGTSKSLFRLLNEGDEIKNVVVFSKSKSDCILSGKPSVCHYVQELKNSKSEKTYVCPSVIRQCFEDKVLVSIMEKKGKTEHIIPKDFVVQEKVDSLLNIGLEEGQTLLLNSIKSPKTKFCSHLKKVLLHSRNSSLQLLYDTLIQEDMIRKLCSEMKTLKLKDVVIGGAYEGKIIHTNKAGTLVRIPELGLDGVIHPNHYSNNYAPKVYETLEVHVLNVNYYELCLELTARRDIKEYFYKKDDHNLKVKQEGKCVILLAKKEYIIGRLLNLCPGQIIYLPSRRHINDFKGRHSYYEIGKQYNIIIEHIDEEFVLANLKDHEHKEFQGICKEIPNFNFNSLYLRNFVTDILLDENRYTHYDFKMKALSKIERVNNWVETKKAKKNGGNLDKWEILKADKFPQLDEELYWKNVLKKREERKKLKKEKLGRIKVGKRKFSESFDENCTDNDEMDDSKDCLESDVTEEQSDNLSISPQEAKLKNKTKKKKLDASDQDIEMEENDDHDVSEEIVGNSKSSNLKEKKRKDKLENKTIKKPKIDNERAQQSLNITEEDSDAMNEDDADDSSTDKCNFLKIETSLTWDEQVLDASKEDDDSDSDSDEEIDDTKEQKSVKKLSKHEKTLKGKAAEMRTRKLELERLDDEREPETALDYEEKIEQNPHSSNVWIEYISFHLENSETEKAREVASRGLAAIPPTKEEERLALWNTSLRLEKMYGTPESLESSFKDALARNDEIKIFDIMIDIWLDANKFMEADELIKKMVKKHKHNPEVWKKSFLYYFKAKELTEAREMLKRSKGSLPIRDYVEVVIRFAQLELKLGDVERGKSLFENFLSSYPKRLDIWNVYADLLLKRDDVQGARIILERITGLKLKMKPIRNAFKKLLEFEKKYGTPQRVEAVKAKVEEYVTAALAEEK